MPDDITVTNVLRGIRKGVWYSRRHLFNSYCVIPFGIVILLTILYGLDRLLKNVIHYKFPASVLGMLINLIFLCLVNILATRKNPKINGWSSWVLDHYLRIVKPSMNFTLKWINVFFIPSFIILPLSPHITFIECLKIAAVFVVGLIALFLLNIYFIMVLKYYLTRWGLFRAETLKEHEEMDHVPSEKTSDSEDLVSTPVGSSRVFTTMRDDITTIDMESVTSRSNPPPKRSLSLNENPFASTPTSTPPNPAELEKPAPIYHKEHASNCGCSNGGVINHDIQSRRSSSDSPTGTVYDGHHHAEPTDLRDVMKPDEEQKSEKEHENYPGPGPEEPEVSTCEQKVTIFISNYIDWLLYLLLFVVSLPFYYITSIHTFLPYHLSITILSYYAALLIPQKWPATKRFAHPILISTAEILFVCFIGSLIYHSGEPKGFLEDLKFYKTGKNYLNLFDGKIILNNSQDHTVPEGDFTATPKWPGCGDVLSSLMDISIVSLSLPMFTYRKDFTRNWLVLVPPILVSIAGTFFLYPLVAYNIGISSERSIGFIGRSVTLALGTPLINNLGGSVSLMACCTILSGIIGVLSEEHLFRFMRVPRSDYLTRGVSLGINCGAIATAHLLNIDPRASSMSSLSFSAFGTVMIILASIGAIRDLIRSIAGL